VTFVQKGNDPYMQPIKHTLLDKMGTIHVNGPQDFEKISVNLKKMRGKERGS